VAQQMLIFAVRGFITTQRKAASMNELSGRRVLVLEDEYFIADDIARTLEQAGAEVVGPFTRHADALNALKREQPVDFAVLDINLQGEISFVVADALKERHVPFVFATGYGQPAIPANHQQVPRWEKPFEPEALTEALALMKNRAADAA
jgi:CheY-like chemotaxis protein